MAGEPGYIPKSKPRRTKTRAAAKRQAAKPPKNAVSLKRKRGK